LGHPVDNRDYTKI